MALTVSEVPRRIWDTLGYVVREARLGYHQGRMAVHQRAYIQHAHAERRVRGGAVRWP